MHWRGACTLQWKYIPVWCGYLQLKTLQKTLSASVDFIHCYFITLGCIIVMTTQGKSAFQKTAKRFSLGNASLFFFSNPLNVFHFSLHVFSPQEQHYIWHQRIQRKLSGKKSGYWLNFWGMWAIRYPGILIPLPHTNLCSSEECSRIFQIMWNGAMPEETRHH